MSVERKQRIEFGDFQTPDDLAREICAQLKGFGLNPDTIIEPTCGVGSFLVAAADTFTQAKAVYGFEVNRSYLEQVEKRVSGRADRQRIQLEAADFFKMDWRARVDALPGHVLVIGNFPWVTNAVQGSIGGVNMPKKSNFLGHNGFDAISGKANFDISEWMLLDVLRWLRGRSADVAMLVKTAVARKVLAHAERMGEGVQDSFLMSIDAKKHFGAAVDACLLVMRLDPNGARCSDYTVYETLHAKKGKRVGHRHGMTVGDLDTFESFSFLLGSSPQKWRSGVKHDASSVMEFTRTSGGYVNGAGEVVQLEEQYLFPLLKGSDIGSAKAWREKFVLVTQRAVGEATHKIQDQAPRTWRYLTAHAEQLDARGSTIYEKNPRFSIFGVGDYAFRPWRIAICGLYKALRFRLVGPIEGRPVMFDDTVYYLSFESERDATETFDHLHSEAATGFLSSLVFWDEKRPIKTSILNALDWSKLNEQDGEQGQLTLNIAARNTWSHERRPAARLAQRR